MKLVWSKIAEARRKWDDDIVSEVLQLQKDVGDFETELYYVELKSDEHLLCLDYLFPVKNTEVET